MNFVFIEGRMNHSHWKILLTLFSLRDFHFSKKKKKKENKNTSGYFQLD